MEAVTGIFRSRETTEHAINRLKIMDIPDENINVLMPGASNRALGEVVTSDTEQPGMGAALGGFVGGVTGMALGPLGAAAVGLLVPGIGPVFAIGIVASALLGAGGVVAGAAAGEALEDSMSRGLPKDELFVYEDALRQGRSVIIVMANDEDQAEEIRAMFSEQGAESVDAAHKQWWLGLRDVEQEHYQTDGRDFAADEELYRRGFETALHPDYRGRSYSDASERLRKYSPDLYEKDPFQRGYERGHRHYGELNQRDEAGNE